MPWSTRKPSATEIAPDWLKSHCKEFLQKLVDQGYAQATMRTYEGAARLLCEEVARRGLRKGELVGGTLSSVQAAALKAMQANKYNQKRYCLERFIDALVDAGVAERHVLKAKALTPLDCLQAEYESYLREQRGLTEATIYHCVRFLVRFMSFRFDGKLGNFDDITPNDIVGFLRMLRGGTVPRDKTGPSHLRNLFRFLFWSGRTKRDLAASIPRARQPAKSTLPRYLKPEEVDKLLDASWAPTPVGRRNYAMLMVLARLGLRAPEAIAIQLDDINWRNGTILIRGKGKRHDRMPLPDDVGKAIVDYSRHRGRRKRARLGPRRRHAHDDADRTSRRLHRDAAQPRLRPVLRGSGPAPLHSLRVVTNIPAAIVSGSVQIGMTTVPVLLQAVDGGLDFVVIAGAARRTKATPFISLLARKDTKIEKPGDLAGKKVGVPGINSVIDVMLRKRLLNGRVPLKQVTVIEAPLPQLPDLLKVGTVDLVAIVEPFRTRIIAGDVGYIAGEYFGEVDPDVPVSAWMATGDWARTIKNFRAAIDEGLAFIKANPEQAKEIEKKYIGSNSPRFPTFENKAKPDDLQVFITIGKELGLYRTALDPQKLVLP